MRLSCIGAGGEITQTYCFTNHYTGHGQLIAGLVDSWQANFAQLASRKFKKKILSTVIFFYLWKLGFYSFFIGEVLSLKYFLRIQISGWRYFKYLSGGKIFTNVLKSPAGLHPECPHLGLDHDKGKWSSYIQIRIFEAWRG